MLIARDAVTSKIASVRSTTGTSITVSPAGFFGFQGGGTPLTNSQVDKLVSLPHVASVQAALSERLSSSETSLTSPTPTGFLGQQFGGQSYQQSQTSTTINGLQSVGGNATVPSTSSSTQQQSFVIPVRVIGTNSPGTALVGGANGGGTEKLTSGTTFSSTSTADVALIGNDLATKNSLKVGSTFTAWKTTITVVGIYNAGSSFADADVLMPLTTVQRLASATGQVTSVTVSADSVDHVAGLVSAIKKSLGSAADVTSTASTVESQLAPLNSVKSISTYTLIGAIVLSAVVLLLSMLMIVRERRREIGVLKALGSPNRSVVAQFVAESTTFTVLGSVVGLLGGIALSSPITSALVTASGGSSSTQSGFVPHFGSASSGGGFPSFGGGGSGFTPSTGGSSSGQFHFGGFHSFSSTLTQLHTSAGWSTLVAAFVIALAIAGVGSAVSASTVTRVRPAEVLRSE
jgi:putative ABC transport system permease protein